MRSWWVVVGATLSTFAPAAMTAGGEPAAEASGAGAVDHVVVIVEQSHTYDAYFGAYPRGDGAFAGGGRVAQPDVAGRSVVARPIRADDFQRYAPPAGNAALSSGRQTALAASHDGAMDSFVRAQQRRGKPAQLPMLYADGTSALGLWRMAEDFVLFDRYFSSVPGGSLPNLISLFTGVTQDYDQGDLAALTRFAQSGTPTVFDQLTLAGVPWRYYVGRLPELAAAQARDGGYLRPGETPSVLYSAPVLAMPRFWQEPLRDHLGTQEEFYTDVATGALPAVSVLTPLPSDQPLTSLEAGQQRLVSLLNTLVKGPDWPSTAVFVVWDDWGGWYDHVAPPRAGGARLGFRVPALLLSPLVRQGYVSSVPHDHRSVLAFIARRFDLPYLTLGEAAAEDFDDAFAAVANHDRRGIIRLNRLPDPPVGTERQNNLVLAAYTIVLGGMTAAGLAWLLWTWRHSLRRVPP